MQVVDRGPLAAWQREKRRRAGREEEEGVGGRSACEEQKEGGKGERGEESASRLCMKVREASKGIVRGEYTRAWRVGCGARADFWETFHILIMPVRSEAETKPPGSPGMKAIELIPPERTVVESAVARRATGKGNGAEGERREERCEREKG